MRPLLLQAGIPERQMKMPEVEPEDIKSERYIEIYDWLHALKLSSEWSVVLKARKLVHESVWEMYRLHEIQGLREQVILESANIKLRKAWKRKRPFFFGRKRKQETNDEETIKNEQAFKDDDTKDSSRVCV
jgi:hypothetical protein